jgi:hypothetical protein
MTPPDDPARLDPAYRQQVLEGSASALLQNAATLVKHLEETGIHASVEEVTTMATALVAAELAAGVWRMELERVLVARGIAPHTRKVKVT